MAYTTTTEANKILDLYACAQESHVSRRKTNAITPRDRATDRYNILYSRQTDPILNIRIFRHNMTPKFNTEAAI